jgi:putative Mg2+ transporter-C (MgtC) family protein
MIELTQTDAAIRIVIALVLGAAVGLEREWKNKSAGLRTYALVCEGAALFMIGSIMLYDQVRESGGTTGDPNRVASTVVQGIGFLAGGVIFTARGHVKGLTTAAGVWVTAAIGVLVGMGFFVIAIFGTVATLVVLALFRYIERWMPVPSGQPEDRTNVPDEMDDD